MWDNSAGDFVEQKRSLPQRPQQRSARLPRELCPASSVGGADAEAASELDTGEPSDDS